MKMAFTFTFSLRLGLGTHAHTHTLTRSSLRASTKIPTTGACAYMCNEARIMLQKKSYSTFRHQNSLNKYIQTSDTKVLDILSEDMELIPDFITEEEEQSLLQEAMKCVKRLRYEFSHFDNAIHGYRETERKKWSELNSQVIKKVQRLAFLQQDCTLAYVHILDLAEDGYIKPHVDAVRFCGDTIAGMSLMSSAVMRLVQESDKNMFGNVYLPQRSLYIMKNRARYNFTHEVLKNEESFFDGQHIPRQRRISIVCRNEPKPEDCT